MTPALCNQNYLNWCDKLGECRVIVGLMVQNYPRNQQGNDSIFGDYVNRAICWSNWEAKENL